jgi:hypothetical protein
MSPLEKKADLLDAARLFFDYWHASYVNKPKKMIFSHQFVDAHTTEELEEIIAKAVPTGEWQFFCLEQPSEYVKNKVLQRYA